MEGRALSFRVAGQIWMGKITIRPREPGEKGIRALEPGKIRRTSPSTQNYNYATKLYH